MSSRAPFKAAKIIAVARPPTGRTLLRLMPTLTLLGVAACGKAAEHGIPAAILDDCLAVVTDNRVEATSKYGLRIVTDSFAAKGFAVSWEPGANGAGVVRMTRIDPLSHQQVEVGFEVSPQPPSTLAPACRAGQTLVSRMDFNGVVVPDVYVQSYLLQLVDKAEQEQSAARPAAPPRSSPSTGAGYAPKTPPELQLGGPLNAADDTYADPDEPEVIPPSNQVSTSPGG